MEMKARNEKKERKEKKEKEVRRLTGLQRSNGEFNEPRISLLHAPRGIGFLLLWLFHA